MIKNPDFLIIPHQIILDKNLQPLDRILYGVIYWLVKLKNERCMASNKTLKELCGCKTNRAISNSLENLEKQGYIQRRYFDNKKRKREEIIPLIVFSKKIGIEQIMTQDRTNDDTGVGTNDEQNNKSTIIIKDNNTENEAFSDKDRKELIYLFKEVNPNYKVLFNRPNQGAALQRMVNEHGLEKVENAIKILSKTNGIKYAPIITTPLQLEDKLGLLVAFIKKERSGLNKIAIIK